jgi:hypothetical protein
LRQAERSSGSDSEGREKFESATLFSVFGALALAIVGVYGVKAYSGRNPVNKKNAVTRQISLRAAFR